MTRIFKKIISRFKFQKRCDQIPDEYFWQSLLAIHRRYFEHVLRNYTQTGRPPHHIYNDFSTIDCWIDTAIENGWLVESKPNK